MQLSIIKSYVRSVLSESEIKAFGYDLRTREAWELLADRCAEYATAAQEVAEEKAVQLVEVLTSEKAKQVYRGIIVAVVLVCAVIGIGLYNAARHYWAEYAKVPVFKVWKLVKRRSRVAQWQLSRWIRLAYRSGVRQLACEWENLVSLALRGIELG